MNARGQFHENFRISEALAKPRAWEGQRPRCPRFASTLGGAASSLPAICRRTGNEDVAPPGFCKSLLKKWWSEMISLSEECSIFG